MFAQPRQVHKSDDALDAQISHSNVASGLTCDVQRLIL